MRIEGGNAIGMHENPALRSSDVAVISHTGGVITTGLIYKQNRAAQVAWLS